MLQIGHSLNFRGGRFGRAGWVGAEEEEEEEEEEEVGGGFEQPDFALMGCLD